MNKIVKTNYINSQHKCNLKHTDNNNKTNSFRG